MHACFRSRQTRHDDACDDGVAPVVSAPGCNIRQAAATAVHCGSPWQRPRAGTAGGDGISFVIINVALLS